MIGIYKITSPSGKIYIGQSVDVESRLKRYKELKQVKSQPRLYGSIKKHGYKNHVFEVLEECLVEELNGKERYYQEMFDVIGENGLNCKLTESNDRSGYLSKETKEKIRIGNLGRMVSDETRKKISEARKGHKCAPFSETHKERLRKASTGKKCSVKSKIKISEANKGNKYSLGVRHTEDTKRRMSEGHYKRRDNIIEKLAVLKRKLILNTETGVYYFGLKEASESVGLIADTLGRRIRKKTSQFVYV